MNRRLTISVIIPAFNEEDQIGPCLQALQRQTVLPDEIIVVNNNSSDATVEIARTFDRVRVISEPNQGLYFARQTGMRHANGDILCRIDADTLVPPQWTEAIHSIFKDASVKASTGPTGYYDFPLRKTMLSIEDSLLRGALILRYSFMFGCNMAIRREVWLKIESELCNNTGIMEDIDMVEHLRVLGVLPVYRLSMTAWVSCRRARDPLPAFYQYIKGFSRTAKLHHKSQIGAYYAEFSYLLAYVLLHPWVVMYDPEKRRFSPRRLLIRSSARPNPMLSDVEPY